MIRARHIPSQAIRTVFCVLLLGALLSTALMPLYGCTTKKTDETIIRESVDEVLSDFKSLDGDMATRFIAEMDIKELGSIGLNTTDFMKSYSDGFDYEISDIRINGDTAEADITLYVKSFSEFEKRFTEEVETISKKYEVVDEDASSSSHASASASSASSSAASAGTSASSSSAASSGPAKIPVTTAEMNAMFARTIINCMKETPVREAEVITIQFTNVNNTWRPSPTALDDILTAMIEN